MTPTPANDPLAKTLGLVPRYMREREAAQVEQRAQEAIARPSRPVPEVMRSPTADAGTSDLRRRIAGAQHRPPALSSPALTGLSFVLGVLLSH